MKTKFKVIGLAVLLVASAFAFKALADRGFAAFGAGGLQFNFSAATNYVVVPNRSQNDGDIIITGVSATSDKTGAVLQFYRDTNTWVAAAGYTNTTTTNYIATTASTGTGSTNGIGALSFLLVEHNGSGGTILYELLQVSSVQGTPYVTNIVVSPSGTTTNYIIGLVTTTQATNNVVPGDTIFQMVTNNAGNIPVGVANKVLNANCIYAGKRTKPLLAIITGGTNASIDYIAAEYLDVQ